MKIAFINIYQNQVDRGAETFVKEISERLSRHHEVKVFSGNKIPGKRWPILWRLFIDPQGLAIAGFTLELVPKILKEKYDVIVPLNGGWQPAIIRLITWLYGGKMIVSGQSGIGWDDRNNLWCFPNTFVALSTKSRLWSGRVMPFVKAVRIPNGVDPKKFKPEGPKYQTKLPKPVVLCVGALTKTKRIDLVIRAVAKMGSASLLVVAGSADREKEIRQLGTSLLGKRFELIKLPFSKMPEVYRAADVFTIASEPYYSFEIVLVEAMASGLPVVANSDPIRREIVGRAGVLVDPTNTCAYAIALENALRLKWGKRPINQAKKFNWDNIALEYEKLFLDLYQ